MSLDRDARSFPGRNGRTRHNHSDRRSLAVTAARNEQKPTVWKFGGSSIATPDLLAKAVSRAAAVHRDGGQLVVILSAMGNTTDGLVSRARELASHPQQRELDVLLSVGEAAACAQAALIADELGVRTVSLSGAQAGITTDGIHGNARIRDIDTTRILAELQQGHLVFVCGFQGTADNGDITTLGRGGSDATAIALAAALGAERCEIFTDVAGVFSANPSIVTRARHLATLSYDEISEIAAGGGRVLQLRAAELAATNDIVVHVRHAHMASVGTTIQEEDMMEKPAVTAVVDRHADWLYEVAGIGLRRAAEVLHAEGLTPGLTIQRNGVLIVTVPDGPREDVEEVISEAGGRLESIQQTGTISLVGRGLGALADVCVAALDCLEGANIAVRGLFTTPSRTVLLTDSEDVGAGTRLLHNLFIEQMAVAA
jgi:aspartate kinase